MPRPVNPVIRHSASSGRGPRAREQEITVQSSAPWASTPSFARPPPPQTNLHHCGVLASRACGKLGQPSATALMGGKPPRPVSALARRSQTFDLGQGFADSGMAAKPLGARSPPHATAAFGPSRRCTPPRCRASTGPTVDGMECSNITDFPSCRSPPQATAAFGPSRR